MYERDTQPMACLVFQSVADVERRAGRIGDDAAATTATAGLANGIVILPNRNAYSLVCDRVPR
jgi:hypothetical protein